jgi:DNA-binding MarR family transcriptional regulator
MTKPDHIAALTKELRLCFHRMAALGDALHADLGITAAMRGVMESLSDGAALTVPQVARAKSVTRQHIQVLVNQLVAARLVHSKPNPRDKRSPLIALTAEGRKVFRAMSEREATVLADLAHAMRGTDTEAALAVLEELHRQLDQRLREVAIDA